MALTLGALSAAVDELFQDPSVRAAASRTQATFFAMCECSWLSAHVAATGSAWRVERVRSNIAEMRGLGSADAADAAEARLAQALADWGAAAPPETP